MRKINAFGEAIEAILDDCRPLRNRLFNDVYGGEAEGDFEERDDLRIELIGEIGEALKKSELFDPEKLKALDVDDDDRTETETEWQDRYQSFNDAIDAHAYDLYLHEALRANADAVTSANETLEGYLK